MSSIGKSIAQIGASFIPGVGPLLSGGIGALGGAIGGSGKQGSQNSNFNQNSTTNSSGTNNVDQFNEAIEDPQFSQFRNSLLPMFQQEFKKSQRPVYGDAQKANFLTELNDLAGASMESLKATLGGNGVLNSGRFNQAATDIELGRAGKAADFFSQIPFLEEERRTQNASSLLGLGMNFAGRAPISQKTTGTNSFNQTGKTTGDGTQMTEQQGPGFWKGLASNLGGLGGYAFGQGFGQQNPWMNSGRSNAPLWKDGEF
jgi:hypothetical protein